MVQQENRIRRFLETFFNATQIEALYFDREMKMFSCNCRRYTTEDFPRLSRGKIEGFLKDLFEKENAAPQSFYTYCLDQNLVCCICVLNDGKKCCGAAVTQPVSLNMLKKADIDERTDEAVQSCAGYNEYVSALQRAPVISHDKIRSAGEVLSALSSSVYEKAEYHQIFCGGETVPETHRFYESGTLPARRRSSRPEGNHSGYPVYLKIKDAMSKGDAGALFETLKTMHAGSVHLDQQTSKDTIRSLKNGFIEGLTMFCFIAIEAGAPYNKMRDLTEEFIRELECTKSVSNMYNLMESALLAFTRSVAVVRINGYSKPVRLAMEYIETHYSEKITLKSLAEQVNLSETYLSTLIKKETGSNIADIINKARIEESKKILSESAVGIEELAAMVGYSYSNHFSKVFKQYTGMTPSGYIKTFAASSEKGSKAKDILRMLLDQLSHYMQLFPGIFDVVRIVDPISNETWMMQQTGEISTGTCYDLWHRKDSCETCISHMALEQDKTLMKLDQGADEPFMVFASPLAAGGHKYVLELLKCASANYFDCTRASQ